MWPLLRHLAGICVVISLANVLAKPASADIVTSFTPPNGSLCLDTLTVDFNVDAGAIDLRGFTVVLEFDPAHVTPIAVTPGTLLTGAACPLFFSWINAAAVGDSIFVDAATLGCSTTGPGSIVRMQFVHGAVQGTSPLQCRSASFRNSLNQSLPYTCPAGSVAYSCPVPATVPTWGSIKRNYR
jgi:hypothetical protein